ncbi:hypothetical protein Tco_1043268 [Tanacetum coccineum]|uniref:Uncharacterized protein n=1 Tax=Tanacetum coccineum TaxID=301880 RepID=A0ABQ5GLJ3_9ASTR
MASNEETNAAGTDTRPPMLVESDYDSWKIRIHRYIRGKPNGKLIWKSIQNGPTPHPMITDPPPTGSTVVPAPRKKLDSEFNEEENKLEMADTQAEIILSQGLPRHIFNILNQTSTAQEIWNNVELLMQGSGRTLQQRKEDLFDEYERFRAMETDSFILLFSSQSTSIVIHALCEFSPATTSAPALSSPSLLVGFLKQFPTPQQPAPNFLQLKYSCYGTDGTMLNEPVLFPNRKAPVMLVIQVARRQDGDIVQLHHEEVQEASIMLKSEAFLSDVECTAPYDQPQSLTTTNCYKPIMRMHITHKMNAANSAIAIPCNLSSTSATNNPKPQNVPTEVSADTSDKVSMIAILTDCKTQQTDHAKEKILSEKKDLADSYLDEIVCLKNANKVARDMLQRFNMPTHTIPMLSKKPKAATADLHKDLLGTRNPGLGYMAKRAQPVLYDADTLLHPTHHPVSIWDSEEVLVHQVVSMKKMNEKPGHVRPENGFYDKLNALMFVPQKELSGDQVYWLSANEIANSI